MIIDVILESSFSISLGVKGTRSSRIVEISIHSFIFIQILVIDFDSTYLNEPGRLTVSILGISIHHSILLYTTRKSY